MFALHLEYQMLSRRSAVMVVEDEPMIRFAAIDIVESCDYEAVSAGNADEAIAILEARTDIRLVFTDVDMPGTMDGVKLTHYVRERWPTVRLIVASGKAIVTEAQLPSDAIFFSKPYADHAIAGAIKAMIGSS